MPKFDPQTILLAFVAITGLAVLLQTIILLAIYLTVRKAANSLATQVEDLRSAVMPVVYNTRELFSRLAPKVESTVEDLSQVAQTLRVQSVEVQTSVNEILRKLRNQTDRIDAMFSTVLDGVDRAGGFVAEVVSRPVRQVSSLLNSLKAIVESLRNSSSRSRQKRSAGEGDFFE
jgi:hypothetical protein